MTSFHMRKECGNRNTTIEGEAKQIFEQVIEQKVIH